jgi:hypothetical protein
MRSAMALLLLTLCLVTSGCGDTVRSVSALRPDKTNPERFVCDLAGTRPTVPPEYKIDWGIVGQAHSVPEAVRLAQLEVAKFVGVLRTREGVVAGYVLDLEDHLFLCFNNARWQREFYAGLPNEDR